MVLQNKGFQSDYIHLLLGHSVSALDSSTKHLISEHPGYVPKEWGRLYNDVDYRKQQVDKYLLEYKDEIEKAAIMVKKHREEMCKRRLRKSSL